MDFWAWWHGHDVAYITNVIARMNVAQAVGAFRQVNPPDVPDDEITNVYEFHGDRYDFTPHLAPGRKRVDNTLAKVYMFFRRQCFRKGEQPGDFEDVPVGGLAKVANKTVLEIDQGA